MLKIYGRNTSSNVQMAMWAIGELNLKYERLDVGGAFGKNKEPDYLAMNPNGLVPTLDEDGFILWESNAIVRYLARVYGAGTLEPSDQKDIARANQWMDWQLTVIGPAFFAAFWGLIRTPAEKRDMAAITASQQKTTEAMTMLDAQLGRTAYVAGDRFSMGDIPVGVMAYRFRAAVPGAAQHAASRTLVCRDRKAAGVPGTRRVDPADVKTERWLERGSAGSQRSAPHWSLTSMSPAHRTDHRRALDRGWPARHPCEAHRPCARTSGADRCRLRSDRSQRQRTRRQSVSPDRQLSQAGRRACRKRHPVAALRQARRRRKPRAW